MKAAKAVGTATKPLATKAASQFGKVQNIAKAKPKVSSGQMSLDLKGAGMKDAGQKVPTPKSPSEVVDPKERLRRAASDMASGTPKTDKNRTGTRTAGESADLFDIVKGQLLDEGLSEEEIRDIMLTLTPDEIMSEMAVNPNIAAMDAKNKADMIARAQANKVPDKVKEASKRQMKAGTPREDKSNPYTTQDKKTIIDYNKDK